MTTEKELSDNSKINELKSLDEFFPKGNKKRGEAMVVSAESFLLGKEAGKSEAITLIDHELRALYFLVKKGHDARIEAEIKVLEKLKGELAK